MWLFLTSSCFAGAPVSNDAATQELQRQKERERTLRQDQEQRPDVRLPAMQAPAVADGYPENEQPCFPITSIGLTGDEAVHFEFALSAVTEGDNSVIGRCLSVQGINTVLARVQNYIVSKGYITTRVLAAPQDLTSGELKLTIIPGRICTIRFADDANPRGTKWNALPISPGDLLNLRDIEQGLENLKRAPTADADIRIEPAVGPDAKLGESDIVIHYKQAFPFRLTLSADDGGSRATGQRQGSITLSGDNLFTLNDLLYISFNHNLDDRDQSERGYTAHYSMPFGYWLLEMTTSDHRYHQAVAGLSQIYLYHGESSNAEIKLSRLIYRDASRKTTLSLLGYLATSRNFIDDTEIQIQRRRMAGWQADISHREFIGNATLDMALGYRHGTGMLNALDAPEETSHEGTSRPKILRTDATFSLPFNLSGHILRYTGNWRAQWNEMPLVPQDQFSIGGRYTVRGFDGETTLMAERGWLLRNELAMPVGSTGQELYLGIDYGTVGGPSVRKLVGQHLAGGVIGLRGGFKGFNWNLFVGGPIERPDGFKPAKGNAGFNLSWTY